MPPNPNEVGTECSCRSGAVKAETTCGHVACVRARLESSVFLFSGSLTDCGLLVAFLTSLKISQMMHWFLFILIFAGSPFAGKLQPLSPVILT